jgi:hypothetical protein
MGKIRNIIAFAWILLDDVNKCFRSKMALYNFDYKFNLYMQLHRLI